MAVACGWWSDKAGAKTATRKGPAPPACIDHAVKVAGIDHVDIGSDFDGIPSVPEGLEDVSKVPALWASLKHCGYSENRYS